MSEIKISEVRRESERKREPDWEILRNKEAVSKLSHIDEVLFQHLDRDIMNHDCNRSIIQNLEDFMNLEPGAPSMVANGISYNTFPFGVPSDLFPRFVAFCLGDMKLRTVLQKAKEQSGKIAQRFGDSHEHEKTVVIVTDKWDMGMFRRYEKDFLGYAVKYGIWYAFLLVTDYGYTEIPFLPYDRKELSGYNDKEIADDIPKEELLDDLMQNPIEIVISSGTPEENEIITYTIYARRWEKKSFYEPYAEGRTDFRALKRFLDDVSWIKESDEQCIYGDMVAGKAMYNLSVFGKTVHWSCVARDSGYLRFARLQNSISDLIAKCEKNAI